MQEFALHTSSRTSKIYYAALASCCQHTYIALAARGQNSMLHIQHCCTCIILHLHHIAYTACYYCSSYIVLAIYCIYSIIVVCAARLLHLQHATLAYTMLHMQHIACTLPSHRICCTCSKTNFTWYHHHHH